jgi:hypothetical protein
VVAAENIPSSGALGGVRQAIESARFRVTGRGGGVCCVFAGEILPTWRCDCCLCRWCGCCAKQYAQPSPSSTRAPFAGTAAAFMADSFEFIVVYR